MSNDKTEPEPVVDAAPVDEQIVSLDQGLGLRRLSRVPGPGQWRIGPN